MVWGCSLLLLAGCATTEPGGESSQGKAVRDKALIEYRSALTAMRQGQFASAKQQLDDALLTLGGMLVPDKAARNARGLFHKESRKTFIGEPY